MLSRSLNVLNPSPPAISLTPAASQGRSRSGTLPSYNSQNHNGYINSSPLVGGAIDLPTMDHISLGLSNNNNHNTTSNNTTAVDIPIPAQHTSSSGRRIRSGSLFLTSSIWNDDAINVSPNVMDNGSIHSASSGSFLSPRLSALQSINNNINNNNLNHSSHINNNNTNNSTNSTNNNNNSISSPMDYLSLNNNSSAANAPRNRSYTTTGAILNILNQNSYNGDAIGSGSRLFSTSFGLSNDMNAYLDSLMGSSNGGVSVSGVHDNGGVNSVAPGGLSTNGGVGTPSSLAAISSYMNSRNRAQTYSGTTPTLSEATLFEPQQQQQTQFNDYLKEGESTSTYPQYTSLNATYSQNSTEPPVLQDDFDITKLNIITNFENPNLGPTRFILFDNLPHFVDALKMWSILSNSLGTHRSVGSIRSVRMSTLNTSKIALIECASIEIAMGLKASFNHLELVPGVVIYIAFVKFEDQQQQQQQQQQQPQQQVQQLLQQTKVSSPEGSNGSVNGNGNGNGNANTNANGSQTLSTKRSETFQPPPTNLYAIQDSLLESIHKLNVNDKSAIDVKKIQSIVSKSINYPNENYQDNFGPLPDPIPLRQFDSPKLRDLRKLLELTEGGSPGPQTQEGGDDTDQQEPLSPLTQLELEELCLAMLDELPELCYDYLGNTIVQKIFTLVESPLIKLMMVKEITPYLTQLGIHKNGTWAIQKIINLCSRSDYQQQYLIGASLKPYAVKLFNDQFGNYVLQGCLKFGSPFNDFIFEAMLDNFLEISFGRFGARSIRTILETSTSKVDDGREIVTKEQVLLVAGLIIQFSNELAVNNNGSLLITWFLDTYRCSSTTGTDDRYKILTAKFLPHLDTLCCHKLANLNILKILNNRTDYQLKQLIMDEIFGKFNESDEELTPVPSKLLETILSENLENSAGPVFIYKILSNSTFLNNGDEAPGDVKNIKYQNFILLQIRRILLELNISNMQPYKKLMDEVGLSSTKLNRSNSLNGGRRNKRGGRNRGGQGQQNQQNHGQHQNQNQNHNHNHNHQQQQHQQQQQQQHQQPLLQGNSHYQGGANQHQVNPYAQMFNPQYNQQYLMLMAQQQMLQGQLPVGHQQLVPEQLFQLQDYYQQHQQQQQSQQDQAVMQQLEQLSLSSAALGYNSNPDTPTIASSQRPLFL